MLSRSSLLNKSLLSSFLYPFLGHPRRSWTSLTRSANNLTIHALNDAIFPYVWLRDSCQSPESIHPSTKQKLHRTCDVPLDIVPVDGGINVVENGLEILWRDGRKSVFDRHWLETYSSPVAEAKFHWDDTLRERSWTQSSISSQPSFFVPYEELLSSDRGLLRAMEHLLKYGLLFVRDVPKQDTTPEFSGLKKLGETFGELRNTFYGLVWDVVNMKDSKNIAYTDLALGLHMDLLYFEHPPRYQILHCIRNKGIGGASAFVDGLHAAQILRDTHPGDFDVLTRTPVSFHYLNDGHHLHHQHFTIELGPLTPPFAHQEIRHINYSPPFQAPLPSSTPTQFYPAFKRFSDLLNHERNTFWYTLEEGEAVIFDNRRVLHGRSAFSDMPEEGRRGAGKVNPRLGEEPNRWLKGCYLEADAILDRVRVLKARLTSKG